MTKNANLDIKITNNCKTLNGKRVSIETDWEIYQSIVFSITQNAIKYNLQNGKVDINLSFTDESEDGSIWMNTLVTDTGIGIDVERQKFLFKNFGWVFGELWMDFGELMAKGQLSQGPLRSRIMVSVWASQIPCSLLRLSEVASIFFPNHRIKGVPKCSQHYQSKLSEKKLPN